MEEEIQTIEEEVMFAGVSSINGQTGDVSLKTINGEEITGEGDITIHGGDGDVKSVNEVTPDENGNVTLTASDVGAQAPLSETQLSAVNSGIDSTKVGQIATNTSDIAAIDGKIPSAASSSNQLADKNFVNSSVATNTANYISDNGEPFDSLADLEAYSGTLTNNDYAFVVGTDSAGNTIYTRYKYNSTSGQWAEEYVLNNSSFSSNQWAAINSGITSGDVTKIAGLAEIKSIGANLNLNSAGELSATDTTYSNFVGTDGATAGTAGLVPAPATTDAGKFLKADGTWDTAGGGSSVTVVQSTGSSTTDVMSQDATTKMVYSDGNLQKIQLGQFANANGDYGISLGRYANANNQYCIAIGATSSTLSTGTQALGSGSIAIGYRCKSSHWGSIALGAYSETTRTGEINISTTSKPYGFSSSNYRVIGGVYDGQDLHDAATVAQGNTLSDTAPTTSTVGVLGQLYTDTTNMHTYQCTAISGDTYTWTQRW